jgi:hypothetical protein
MLKIISSKKIGQIAMIRLSKPRKWDNLTNIKGEASRHFRNKMKEYLKDNINKLTMNSKN